MIRVLEVLSPRVQDLVVLDQQVPMIQTSQGQAPSLRAQRWNINELSCQKEPKFPSQYWSTVKVFYCYGCIAGT